MNRRVWREVRFSLYLAFILNGVIIQWLVPFRYRCNIAGTQCPACGLRTAVDLFLQGRFAQAVSANPLIILVLLLLAGMTADIALCFIAYLRQRNAGAAR